MVTIFRRCFQRRSTVVCNRATARYRTTRRAFRIVSRCLRRNRIVNRRPFSIQRYRTTIGSSQVADRLLIGVGSTRAVRLSIPTVEGIARFRKAVGSQSFVSTISMATARRRAARIAVSVILDGVSICRPVCRVRLIARRAFRNRYGLGRRRTVATRPTREGITRLGGVIQRKGRRFNVIRGRVRLTTCKLATIQGIRNRIGVTRPNRIQLYRTAIGSSQVLYRLFIRVSRRGCGRRCRPTLKSITRPTKTIGSQSFVSTISMATARRRASRIAVTVIRDGIGVSSELRIVGCIPCYLDAIFRRHLRAATRSRIPTSKMVTSVRTHRQGNPFPPSRVLRPRRRTVSPCTRRHFMYRSIPKIVKSYVTLASVKDEIPSACTRSSIAKKRRVRIYFYYRNFSIYHTDIITSTTIRPQGEANLSYTGTSTINQNDLILIKP